MLATFALTGCHADGPPPQTHGTQTSGEAGAPTTAASGIVIPDAPIDRSDEGALTRQWWEAKAECLTENGFAAHYDGIGIEITGTGPGQWEASRKQSELCAEEVTARLGPIPVEIPYSVEELKAKYALMLEVNACLDAASYPVQDPPSEDAFVRNEQLAYTGNTAAIESQWSPYPSDPNQSMEAMNACPPPMGPEITRWLHAHGS